MKLLATLPSIVRQEVISDIFSCPEISGFRFNTGVHSPFSPRETLEKMFSLAGEKAERIWIDLDGRQLRVNNWSYPKFGGKLSLNRSVTFSRPAEINFRGDGWYELAESRGRSIFLNSLPRHALGAGQTANIFADRLEIKGPYLTGLDRQYLREALKLGGKLFMLSFFERESDIAEIMEIAGDKKISLALKIENNNGLLAARKLSSLKNITLVAARDDWYINSRDSANFHNDLAELVRLDKKAIVASRIFSSLEKDAEVSAADWEDLQLLEMFGYKNFMFSDGLCNYKFKEAISAWRKYQMFRKD